MCGYHCQACSPVYSCTGDQEQGWCSCGHSPHYSPSTHWHLWMDWESSGVALMSLRLFLFHWDASNQSQHFVYLFEWAYNYKNFPLQLFSTNNLVKVQSKYIPMHLMPASCVWSHMCTPRKELQSSTRCSSPLQASWSRKMGPTPWPKLAPRNANVPK